MLPAHAKRIALVMGNDNYTSVTKLQKAGNDATAMARELKAAGFTVQLHRDLNYRGMVKAVETFANSITGGDEVVVFFAGHGVQIKNGSYLLPTDIEANSEKEVEKTAYELLALTDMISEAKPAFSLVMIDACRDNPLKASGRSVGNLRGLSALEPPKGQIVVYSASRGQQALDRLNPQDSNPNGIFTREFITRMKKPGVKIEDLMREVQDSVESLAKSVNHEQRPAVYNEARGNFYFFAPITVQAAPIPPAKPDSSALELAMWDGVKNATTVAEFQAYLSRFPNGFFAELARARIVAIGGVKLETVSAVTQSASAEQQLNTANNSASPETIKDSTTALTNNSASSTIQNSPTQPIAPQISNLPIPGSIIKDCVVCPAMVVIPAGTFEMGSTENNNSMPVHLVNVSGFLMGETEVSQGQWKSIMGSNPSYSAAMQKCFIFSCPVERVTWDEAVEFTKRLSQMTGKNYRLPSEAEWEYAARAGSKTKWSFGDDEKIIGEFAWYIGNSYTLPRGFFNTRQPWRVAHPTKRPNAFGLFDMHGNVSEYTMDCQHNNYIGAPTDGSAWILNGKCSNRIIRGGYFDQEPEKLTSAYRTSNLYAGNKDQFTGFRVARDQ
jgi:formylglycine-generating enzyme required for sulfatase activity